MLVSNYILAQSFFMPPCKGSNRTANKTARVNWVPQCFFLPKVKKLLVVVFVLYSRKFGIFVISHKLSILVYWGGDLKNYKLKTFLSDLIPVFNGNDQLISKYLTTSKRSLQRSP